MLAVTTNAAAAAAGRLLGDDDVFFVDVVLVDSDGLELLGALLLGGKVGTGVGQRVHEVCKTQSQVGLRYGR